MLQCLHRAVDFRQRWQAVKLTQGAGLLVNKAEAGRLGLSSARGTPHMRCNSTVALGKPHLAARRSCRGSRQPVRCAPRPLPGC